MFNQMLIAAQRPSATQVAGYRKWEELGRHVMKGEKGISIFAPKMVRITALDGAGAPVKDAKGKLVRNSRCVGFTTATVFDAAQTDGDPLPTIDRELTESPPDGFKEDLEAAIAQAGFTVTYEPITGGASGFTEPVGQRVVVDSSLSPANTAQVLAHELGHIKAGHLDRMDEYHTGHAGSRGAMEVEADSVSAVLCRSQGMSTDVIRISSTYVAGWSRDNPDAVKESAQKVSTTVKAILESGTWRNSEVSA
jgi:antirestriction protein ArdC